MQTKGGINILLENYTDDGLNRRQLSGGGYAIVSSEEGGKFLSSVNNKQRNKEGEYQNLCQLWGGEGETMSLKDEDRHVEKTSLSICMFIQPKSLMEEMIPMGGGNGTLDRLNILCVQPRKIKMDLRIKSQRILKTCYTDDALLKLFELIFDVHQANDRTYTLSTKAETFFNTICDEIVDDFNSQYETNGDFFSSTFICCICSLICKLKILIKFYN